MKIFINRFKIFIILDVVIILITFFSNHIWLLNTQIAFFSSIIITIGSFYGYKNNINNRIKEYPIDNNEIDEDDKYDLYSDEVTYNQEIKEEEITKEQIKETMKPIKQIKQNYFKNFTSSMGAMASFYRLFGYIFLIIGFFYLRNNGYLDIYSYLLGFSIVPISTMLYAYIHKNNT